jgi:hypothetical protein
MTHITWNKEDVRLVDGVPDTTTIPDEFANIGWLRTIDEEMVAAHIGVANLSDSYESAKIKLNSLIQWHVDAAIDPKVNGGYVLRPLNEKPVAWMDREGDVYKELPCAYWCPPHTPLYAGKPEDPNND